MSSYLTIYAKNKESKDIIPLLSVSRSHPLYTVFDEDFGVRYLSEVYKESYLYRKDSPRYKQVKYKSEMVEPIPENEEWNIVYKEKGLAATKGMPSFDGYYCEEEYQELPTFKELIVAKGTHITGDLLDYCINKIKEQIVKDTNTLNELEKHADGNLEIINEIIWRKEYLDDQKETVAQLNLFAIMQHTNVEFYCYID